MKKLFIVFLLLFCFTSVAYADLTQHSEAELDALLQVLDPEFDGTMDPQLVIWAGVTPSANGQALVGAANYAAMRGLLDLEAGTDFYSMSAADSTFEASGAAAALQADDLVTLSGVALGAVNLGAFTGATITDNQTIKAAFQELETALEGSGGTDAKWGAN